jgi:prophage maintenance system killer protein
MDWQITFLIFTACASAHIFYNLGKRTGISSTLDYLKADGQIDFDDD